MGEDPSVHVVEGSDKNQTFLIEMSAGVADSSDESPIAPPA